MINFICLKTKLMNKKQIIEDNQSRVISLRFFNEKKYSQEEVAKILKISISQVKRYEKKYKKNLT